ncbi:MAG: protoheme farnesyltransferase [Chloroflexi bacterium]|jgi:protoheme IX farnesyltransferase|nr:protoheme farnesyltransferase [Chloroflexota bacterium]
MLEVTQKPENSRGIRSWKLPLKWYQRLTLATAVAIWLLIVLGGIVRVTESGTGCGNSWPMCHGRLLPNLEYHELIEWNHRLVATLVGILMIVMGVSTLIWYRKPRRLLFLALASGVFYLTQAILGGITVLLNLDHTWVAAHMGNSMLLMASVTLLALFARIGPIEKNGFSKTIRWLALGTLIWTYLALFTGSAVIGTESELSCAAWPQCQTNQFLPNTPQEWVNFGHRLAVGLSDIMLLALAIVIWRSGRRDKRVMRAMHFLGLLYISQVFLGAFTVWLGAPAYLKGAHLALAALTWAALVILSILLWVSPVEAKANDDTSGGNGEKKLKRGKQSKLAIVPEPVRDYVSLMRLKVIPLLLVPTVASMLIAAVQYPVPQGQTLLGLVLWTVAGGVLATGGAHTINQFLERDLDALMRRTKRRPLVTGKIAPERALAFGVSLTVVGVVLLWIMVNPVASMLSLAGNLFYVVVYTMWLKRTTVQNIVIGGAAGSVPPLVGWAAITGDIGLPAVLFFAIIFFWTPAHFWALALVRREDYEAAGVPMLPAVKGDVVTQRNILYYAVLLVIASVLPFMIQALSWLYLVTALLLGWVLISKSFQLLRKGHHSGMQARAMKLFKFSNTYLALLYLVMVVDRLIALG